MTEQAKIYRVLKLISILKQRARSVEDLAEIFEVNKRTVYRYLNLLESLGFILDKDFHDNYFIADYENDSAGIQFDPEEAGFLKSLVETGAHGSPFKESILKKLYLNSEIKGLSEDMLQARTAHIIRKLSQCLEHENQAALLKYHSASSGNVRDRRVEVISFSNDYENVFVFDTEDQKTKNFKIERIGDVMEMDQPVKFKEQHGEMRRDIFGMTGDESLPVKIRLSFRAYLLLREEHPESINFISEDDAEIKSYILDIQVTSFAGVSRFVLGLIDQVEVLASDSFKTYLNNLLKFDRF